MKNIFLIISKRFVFVFELYARLVYRNKTTSKVIFIVGVPRSGSTFLYQELTNTLKFGYTDNYTHYVTDKSFVGGNIVSEYLLRNKPHNCFKSTHGNTSACGLCAPNEAGKYWRMVRNGENITFIKKHFELINAFNKKPYIVKNLYTSLIIDKLSKILPDAKFIYIKRDKESNVKSLITARKKVGVSSKDDWSVMPPYKNSFKSEIDRVNFQYDEINRIISKQLDTKKKYEIDYNQFILDKEKYIKDILKFCFEDE